MKTFYIILFALVAYATQGQTPDPKVKEFDAYIESSQKLFQIPGLAITVVKDGKVILKKGYGVRQLGTTNAVDTQTLFACASTHQSDDRYLYGHVGG